MKRKRYKVNKLPVSVTITRLAFIFISFIFIYLIKLLPPYQGVVPEIEKIDDIILDTTHDAEELENLPKSEPDPIQVKLESMTLHEKIYQLFFVFPTSITGIAAVKEAGETFRLGLEKFPVGGIICDKNNLISQEQISTMLENMQSYSKIPLFISCDEEGGRVNRLMSTVGTTWVGAMLSYKEQGAEKAAENARIIGESLLSCGFNMDFAPVADVWSNPKNSVIGNRAYSDNFEEAATLVSAAVGGFHEAGVICTLKHFPGHGDTIEDSHSDSAYVHKTLEELRTGELLPFVAGIEAGTDVVMIGHLIVEDIDTLPAPFSFQIVTELLREELNFNGVVITDSLEMKALADNYTDREVAVKAIKAGVDMLLCPNDLEDAADALIQAVENGEISIERIDESLRRILILKQSYGLLS